VNQADRAGKATEVATPKSGDPLRANACGPPDHKETYLLMATQNPTGEGPLATLAIDPEQGRILRPLLAMVREGIQDDLASYANALREPARLRREEEAAGCLLAALAGAAVEVREEMRTLAAELAESVDLANEYERVIAEHDALKCLVHLLDQGAR